MPFNVLLLPLLGGYFFVTNWNPTRFSTRRYSGERLLFHAAAAGLCWLVVAFALVAVVNRFAPEVRIQWAKLVPFPYAGTSVVACALGAFGWWPMNGIAALVGNDREEYARRAMDEWGDYLELLLEEAIQLTRSVAVTLKNGKVYVGFVLQNFDPSYDRKYLRLLPTDSGYRSQEDHTLHFTTTYSPVLNQVVERLEDAEKAAIAKHEESLKDKGVLARAASRLSLPTIVVDGNLVEPDHFNVVLPVAEIQSAVLWDWDAYEMFQDLDADEGEEGNPDPPEPGVGDSPSDAGS